MEKINYHNIYLETLKNIKNKPTLLLHVCCGPCSGYTLTNLIKYFDVTIYYSNDNIHPSDEYHRRLNELKQFISISNLNIEIIEKDYTPKQFLTLINPFKHLPEKSQRCYTCYKSRMSDARKYADDHNFDYWTTVLSVSPHKNSQWINEIGLELSIDSKFLHSDFKKDQGYLKSTKLANEFDLYRQHYCGCVYSYKEMLERNKDKQKDL